MELIVAIVIAIVIYSVQTMLYRRLWDKNLKVELRFEEECVTKGSLTCLSEIINNAKFLPMPVFHLKFSCSRTFRFDDTDNAVVTDAYHRNDVFSVMGNQKVTRKLTFTAERRGYYEISSFHILTRDFFLVNRFARLLKNDTHIYVLPGKREDSQFTIMFQRLLGEILNQRSFLEDPYTFRGIRDYDRSDNMHSINWKATAKHNALMVNMHERVSEQRVKLMLNLETNTMIKTEELQEIAIELTSSIAGRLIQENIPVQLTSNGLDVITKDYGMIESGCTYHHLLVIDRYLARLSVSGGIDAFLNMMEAEEEHKDRNTAYVIISPYFKSDLIDRLDSMAAQGLSVQMVVPYYDIQELENRRPYMHALEVKLTDA